MTALSARRTFLPAVLLAACVLALAIALRERFDAHPTLTSAQAKEAIRRAIADAQLLAIHGQMEAAGERLRRAALSGPADAELYVALAQTLLTDEAPDDAERAQEALLWAQRACALTRYEDPTALATLAAAQRKTGDDHAANVTLRRARELARRRGRPMSLAEEERR